MRVNPKVCRGHCNNRPASAIAPLHSRYVGLYHWSTYWHNWDKVIAVNNDGWTVAAVVVINGKEILSEPRHHMTQMDARCFADKPFMVEYV